jgi:hypothetical protein
MKKNIASIANDTTKAMPFVPRNARLRRNENSTIGNRVRPSTIANDTSPATEAAARARIRGEPQPQPLPSTSASTSAPIPTVSVATPA